jgi:hypothetical protein
MSQETASPSQPPSSESKVPRPPLSPARKSINLTSPSGELFFDNKLGKTPDGGAAAPSINHPDFLSSVEFVPPIEGTPAAIALAGNDVFSLFLSFFSLCYRCSLKSSVLAFSVLSRVYS